MKNAKIVTFTTVAAAEKEEVSRKRNRVKVSQCLEKSKVKNKRKNSLINIFGWLLILLLALIFNWRSVIFSWYGIRISIISQVSEEKLEENNGAGGNFILIRQGWGSSCQLIMGCTTAARYRWTAIPEVEINFLANLKGLTMWNLFPWSRKPETKSKMGEGDYSL